MTRRQEGYFTEISTTGRGSGDSQSTPGLNVSLEKLGGLNTIAITIAGIGRFGLRSLRKVRQPRIDWEVFLTWFFDLVTQGIKSYLRPEEEVYHGL